MPTIYLVPNNKTHTVRTVHSEFDIKYKRALKRNDNQNNHQTTVTKSIIIPIDTETDNDTFLRFYAVCERKYKNIYTHFGFLVGTGVYIYIFICLFIFIYLYSNILDISVILWYLDGWICVFGQKKVKKTNGRKP